MSPSSWKTSLGQLLRQPNNPPGVAILGIGNTLRSDDAAGVLVARRLAQARLLHDLEGVLIIDAGFAPENATAKLRVFAPGLVILIDAAQMNEVPGAVRWIGMEEMDGLSASSHTMPLFMLARYIRLQFSCEVTLLGIQPLSTGIGESISSEVLQAVDEIAGVLESFLQARSLPEPHKPN